MRFKQYCLDPNQDQMPAVHINNLESEPVSQSRVFFSENKETVHESINNYAPNEPDGDDEEVSFFFFIF